MSSVAIIVPVYREALTPDEGYAVRHLHLHLGHYDCYQISPHSLAWRVGGLSVRKYEDRWFTGVDSYSALMLSRWFYQDFASYDYILIYQLDCLALRDDLESWCAQGFDYIGAPLFNLTDLPESGFSGACNGGFSLRRVSAFLDVLNSPRYAPGKERVSFLADVLHRPFVEVRPTHGLKRWLKRLQVARQVRSGVSEYTRMYRLNEDHFWSSRACYFRPGFRIAPPEIALQFAFETAPAWCFERNGRRLPFGAHAWQKWDRRFWEPHLTQARHAATGTTA